MKCINKKNVFKKVNQKKNTEQKKFTFLFKLKIFGRTSCITR